MTFILKHLIVVKQPYYHSLFTFEMFMKEKAIENFYRRNYAIMAVLRYVVLLFSENVVSRGTREHVICKTLSGDFRR